MTLTCLAALARLREAGRFARLFAENKRLRIENAELRGQNHILRSRLDRIPARQRPHYAPEVRFQILEHMKAFLLSVEETARRFLVTPQTLYNWLRELEGHPDAQTIGVLLRPAPPLTRYANVVRRLARQMKAFGFGGDRQIAQTLTPLGWKPSSTLGRPLLQGAREGANHPAYAPQVHDGAGPYPNHLWLADITHIPTVFPFLHLHLAVVFDAFSRMPLRVAISYFEPSAHAMLDLVQAAIHTHGQPRHFVSDRGSQFAAEISARGWTLGIRHRFGALYQHGSIALIERFFKTLKADLRVDTRKAWNLADLERRLVSACIRYAYCRLHSALAGRMPVELFFGIADQRPLSNRAPRGSPADPDVHVPPRSTSSTPTATASPSSSPPPRNPTRTVRKKAHPTTSESRAVCLDSHPASQNPPSPIKTPCPKTPGRSRTAAQDYRCTSTVPPKSHRRPTL